MSVITTEKNITNQIATSIQPMVLGDPTRSEAFNHFLQQGLPLPKNEEYKYTPITRILEKNFTFAPAKNTLKVPDVKQFYFPGIDGNVLVFINGIFSKEHSSIVSPAKEIEITSLKEAITSGSPVALQHFAKYNDFKTNVFSAWNTAAWSDGIFIRIADNAVIEKPLIIYQISDTSAGDVVIVNRNLLVLGKNSEVTIIEKSDSVGSGNHFSNIVTEIAVEENAGLNIYKIQHDSGNRYQHEVVDISQKKTSRVNTYTFSLQGKLLRNNLNLQLDGEGIESHMYGLYLIGADTIADNHTVVDHKKPNSFSNELYKGIIDENAKGVFNGKIFVRPQAQKTNAFQSNKNILLSDKATINTKPQLEIWADDVKCSHGCTTGQLDEEALFYLQARGISKETARAMILYAFAGEVLEHVKHPQLKDFLDHAISGRLHKNF